MASAVTLTEAWDAAEQHSAEYTAARYARDASLEQQKQAKAALLPQISAYASYQRQPPSLSNSKETRSWNIQLNQTLFDSSKRAQIRQSEHNSDIAEQQYQQQHEDLLLQVSQNYFDFLLSRDIIASAESEKKAYAQQVTRANELFKHGAATVLDIHEAQAGYDNAYAQQVAALTDQQIYANQFFDLTGLDAKNIQFFPTEQLTQYYQPNIQAFSLENWQAIALYNNHEYQRQKATVASQYEALNVAKNSRLPVVTANVGYQHNRYTYPTDHYTGKGLNAGLNVSVPLYTGGERSSRIREATAKHSEAEYQLLAMERKIRLAVRQAYTQSLANIQQINAQKRLLNSSQLKLKSTQIGQQYGFRNQLEVLQAQQEVARAEQQLAKANYQFLMHYLTLIKESGLGLKNKWREPPMLTVAQPIPMMPKKVGHKRR